MVGEPEGPIARSNRVAELVADAPEVPTWMRCASEVSIAVLAIKVAHEPLVWGVAEATTATVDKVEAAAFLITDAEGGSQDRDIQDSSETWPVPIPS
jgi:hypothetical protein